MLGEYASAKRDPVRELELLQYCEGANTSYAARRNHAALVAQLIDYLETHEASEEEWLKAHDLIGQSLSALEGDDFSEAEGDDDDLDLDALIGSILGEDAVS